MKQNLEIVSFDLETTGVDTIKDRIVQIAVCHFQYNIETKQISVLSKFESFVNPQIPIPTSASEIHGIYDDDVKEAPKFAEIAKTILPMFVNSDCLSGYNIGNFDVPLILSEFYRVNIDVSFAEKVILDTFKINNFFNPRTLSNVYKNYTQRELVDAHNAMSDVDASNEVLFAQIELHSLNLQNPKSVELEINEGKERVDFARKFSVNDKGQYIFAFGKHEGKPVHLEKSYLSWMLGQDFPLDTKTWISKFLKM